jgi:MFS family permease
MEYARNIKILTAQGFLLGLSLWAPIEAIYFAKVTGSYAAGLSIFSVTMITSVLLEIPTGVFSDKIGRKWTTTLGGFFYALSGIFYALGFNYWWLFIGAMCEGGARAFYSGNNDALLYDSLEKTKKDENLAKFMGFIGSSEQWALGISAVIGGVLATTSFKLVLWLSVIPLLICFVSSFWLIEVPNKEHGEGNIFSHLGEAWKNFVNNEKLRLLSLSDIIGYGLGEAAYQFRSVFVLTLWPLWAIGVSKMLSSFGAAIGFGLSGKILKKFRAIDVVIADSVYSKVINFTSFIWPTVWSPALMSTTSVMYGPASVAGKTLFQKEFSDKQRATMGSMNSLGGSLFFALSAMLIGWIADVASPRIALIWGQILGLVAVVLTWKLFRLMKREEDKKE